MNPDFNRRIMAQIKLNPYIAPGIAGMALLAVCAPFIGFGVYLFILCLWAALWAVLEAIAPMGYPKRWVKLLTPNFYAVMGMDGYWRIFQRRAPPRSCRTVLRDLLDDQHRLPEALTPGRYRTLTHETVLHRLEAMANVSICSSRPAYVAALETTISQAVGRRCRHCADRCPFPARHKLRQFYDICFTVY